MTKRTSQSTGSAHLTPLRLRWLPGRYGMCQLGPHEVIPPWAVNSRGFLNITRTVEELSIIVHESSLPEHIQSAERNLSLMRVVGRLDFSLIGVLSSLTAALTKEKVSVLAVSSYDTDYLLVRSGDARRAEKALSNVAIFEHDGRA